MKKLMIALWILLRSILSGKKYNVYFYAIMYQTILTYLVYLRAITAAYSIFTTIMLLLIQFGGRFFIF